MPIGGYAAKQAILTSAARTTNGQSSNFNVSEFSRLTFYTNVSAASGTSKNLNIKIQESPDQSTWYDMDGLEGDLSAIGSLRLTTDEQTLYIRVNYSITGTNPSFTFTVDMVGRH